MFFRQDSQDQKEDHTKYWKRRVVDGLEREGMLSLLGLPNDLSGMREYESYLYTRGEGDAEAKGLRRYFQGWSIGAGLLYSGEKVVSWRVKFNVRPFEVLLIALLILSI